MKKFIVLTLFCLSIIVFCFARTNIVVISAEEIASQSGSLNDAVTSLAGQGYGILHYDRHHILAIAPEIPNKPMIEASFLSEYPPAENIYLVGKIPGFAQESLDKAGKVLWEMDAAYVLESGLGDLELQGVLRNPCARLSLEPIRLHLIGTGYHSGKQTAALSPIWYPWLAPIPSSSGCRACKICKPAMPWRKTACR